MYLMNMMRCNPKVAMVVQDDSIRIDLAREYSLDQNELGRIFTYFDFLEKSKTLKFEKIVIDGADHILNCLVKDGQEIVAVTV